MKRFQDKIVLFSSALVLLLASCKKEETITNNDAPFTVTADGYKASFTATTPNAASYKWDFGDGQTATDQNPVHIYAKKGKYVPTLTVTTTGGATKEGSTVLRIVKGTAVRLNDNSVSDWDTVAKNVYMPANQTGFFRKAKFDYDGSYVYFYFEVASKESNLDIYDFYLDTDNSRSTGLIGNWSTGATDVLLEGQIFNGWWDMFNHKGAQNAFSFDYVSTTDFYTLGTKQQVGSIFKFEGRIERSKIKNLANTTGMNIAVTATKSDWSVTLGFLPESGKPAINVDMSE